MEKHLILLFLLLVVVGCSPSIPQTITADQKSDGKPSSPLDLVLVVSTLDNGQMDITVTLSMPPKDRTNLTAKGVDMDILVPEEFQIVDGKPGIRAMDIGPGETVTRTIRVKNVKDGSGVISASCITAHNETEAYFGEREQVFFYAQDGKVRLSTEPFTSSYSDTQSTAVQIDPKEPTQSDATPIEDGAEKKR
jgi:hypothetical protein